MPLSLRRCDHNTPKINRPVIALKIDWSRFTFFAVKRPSCNAWNFLIGNNSLAIGYNSYHSPDKRDVKRLPLASVFCGHFTWCQKTVDGAEESFPWIFPFVVRDLNFITSTQIYTAVASFLITKFNMKFKVVKG